MNILKLATAAAIAVSSFGLPLVPAAAQGEHRGEMRHDGDRHDMGRDDNDRRWGNDNNGRHRGWRNHHRRQVCRWVWRYHHRTRICTWRRWR
ncbi:MAG: hypothetical protein QOH47_3101 [Sphingomonadales bacterium]|jgi:hypothetical protein|nr:hypothetical protein [Sphingomonadales bacterium]